MATVLGSVLNPVIYNSAWLYAYTYNIPTPKGITWIYRTTSFNYTLKEIEYTYTVNFVNCQAACPHYIYSRGCRLFKGMH